MPPRNPPLDLQAILDELQRNRPFTSLADANRRLAARLDDYNSRPQADLGGLSPDQMAQLMAGDWLTTGALRLDPALTLDDVGSAPILADARTLLQYVADHGPIKPTQAGNLPRRAVLDLLPQLRTVTPEVHEYLPRAVNELDVLWLFVVRHLLEFAKLLVRRKGLTISRSGRDLLKDDRAGELYVQLFLTLFRTFDLGFLDNSDRHPGLQPTVAFSFYKLQHEARDWSTPQDLAESSWLPDAKDPPSPSDMQYGDLRYYTLISRVLKPLVQFGLMERRTRESSERLKEYDYRLTPLFTRFLRFQFNTHPSLRA